MKVALVVPVLLFAAWCAPAGDDPDKLYRDVLKSTQDVAALLKTVKDKQSAEAAVRKLEEAADRLLSSTAALDKLPASVEAFKAMKTYAPRVEAANRALKMETDRLAKQPDLAEILRKSASWKKLEGEAQEAKLAQAKVDVKGLQSAVVAFKLANGQYPLNLQALLAKYIEKSLLTDPWGRPYEYDPAVRHPTTDYPLIYSLGPDPKDKKGYIRNWDK